ncbi:MAG TPA: hypothetical protein VGB82_13985 [Alphaproteobacteria bacterium]
MLTIEPSPAADRRQAQRIRASAARLEYADIKTRLLAIARAYDRMARRREELGG